MHILGKPHDGGYLLCFADAKTGVIYGFLPSVGNEEGAAAWRRDQKYGGLQSVRAAYVLNLLYQTLGGYGELRLLLADSAFPSLEMIYSAKKDFNVYVIAMAKRKPAGVPPMSSLEGLQLGDCAYRKGTITSDANSAESVDVMTMVQHVSAKHDVPYFASTGTFQPSSKKRTVYTEDGQSTEIVMPSVLQDLYEGGGLGYHACDHNNQV